jgi:hypothetical protein
LKTLIATLCLVLSSSAFAGILYSNGPVNGSSNAYFIDTYTVSDQFSPSGSQMYGFGIAEWVPAGATPLSFDWDVGTSAFGSDLGSGVATIGGGGNAIATVLCYNGGLINGYGYDVYNIDVTTGLITVGAGDWLTLFGAADSYGGRDAWDVNFGPSAAEHSLLGSIDSETFTINGAAIPEPSTFLLLGGGLLGLAALRRKFGR